MHGSGAGLAIFWEGAPRRGDPDDDDSAEPRDLLIQATVPEWDWCSDPMSLETTLEPHLNLRVQRLFDNGFMFVGEAVEAGREAARPNVCVPYRIDWDGIWIDVEGQAYRVEGDRVTIGDGVWRLVDPIEGADGFYGLQRIRPPLAARLKNVCDRHRPAASQGA